MVQSNWVGKTLGGRYQIDEMLGQGGMSAVYKATDPNLRRVVAVKLIHPHLSDNPEFVSRFEEEAASVAQLRHPNIIQVFDFNNDEGVYYMVLEFVPGETLQERLKRLTELGRNLPYTEAIKFGINVSEAADFAHKRGLIHRDIKPANVMLDVQGQAILMDFGIARIVGGQRHTATGAVIGTALYMAPEQIRGESPDHRADLYSIGVTLFEAVRGTPPFEADSAMTLMMMHLNDPVPNLRQLQPDVPEDLVRVIEKSLAKDRSQRYQSGEEMAKDLKKVLARLQGKAVADMPVTDPLKTGRVASAAVAPPEPQVTPGGTVVVQPAGSTPEMASAAQADQAAYGASVTPGGTVVVPETPQGAPATAAVAAGAGAKRQINPLLIGGAALGIIIVCSILGFLAFSFFTRPAATRRATATPTLTETVVAESPTPEDTLIPTETTAPPTSTLAAAEAVATEPQPTLVPSPVIPPGIPYVLISDITIEGNLYVVTYETFEFTEQLPGVHIHFFFNTVPPEQAGSPGSGPWILYGGPRPFKGYRVSDRPSLATQMCALVANANHSVQPDSGNCYYLPDVEAGQSPNP